jgi:hypothetical protein
MVCHRAFVFGTSVSVWCLGLIAVGVAHGQTLDPRFGTWHLNAAQSTFSPASEIRSLTIKVQPTGDGETVINEFTYADGAIVATQYTAYFDGRDYYLTGSPNVDSVALQRIDARTTERIDKKRGEVVQTFTRTVSEDGKTMTVKIRGKDWLEQDVRHTLIFEKR